MNYNLFAQKLISLIQENTTSTVLPAAFLAEVLSMGKEAAYRRLRGDVPFTFDEMIKISQRLEVSLDEIANPSLLINRSKWATINLDTLYPYMPNYTKQYYENIIRFKEMYQEMTESTSSLLRYAEESIPFSIILKYKKLSLFNHYKWMYLTQKSSRAFTFGQMTLPADLLDLEKQFIESSLKIPRTLFLLDRNIFLDLVNDINYFFNEGLVSKEELLDLKTELLKMTVYIEELAKTGIYQTGNEINIYLANVNIGSSYAHIEYEETEYAVNILYFLEIVVYQNSKICQKQKNWIDLLKRFSTHITQTGEKERFEFFTKQREMIENLL